MYKLLRRELGVVFRGLAEQKECYVEQGTLMPDYVHMLLSVPPKYSVSQVVGFIKGKSAIYIARNFGNRKINFSGYNFWARGYYVSTVGRDEETIRAYIKKAGIARQGHGFAIVARTAELVCRLWRPKC